MERDEFENHVVNLKDLKKFQKILESLSVPRFGSITIVIHDGEVVQIEKKEKYRVEINRMEG